MHTVVCVWVRMYLHMQVKKEKILYLAMHTVVWVWVRMYLHARGIGDGQGVLREGVTGQALDLTLLLGGGGVRHMVGVRRNPGRGRETENRKFVTCDGDLLFDFFTYIIIKNTDFEFML